MLKSTLRFITRMSYYAVANGREVGIFNSWADCEQQVKGFSGAKFKKFKTVSAANAFVTARCGRPYIRPTKPSYQPTCQPTHQPSYKRAYQPKHQPSRQPQSYIPFKEYSNVPSTSGYKSQCARYSKSSSSVNKPPSTLTHKDDYTEVYTDGASSNNGQRGAAAGIGVYWDDNSDWNVSERLEGRQTNNRAEIHAVCRAVDQARVRGIPKLRVYTDSNFLIQSYTKWMPKWKQNGWKLASGGPVKNKEDFEELDELIQGIDVQFQHVSGHSGNAGNDAADKLAVAGAKQPYLFNNIKAGDFSDSDDMYDD